MPFFDFSLEKLNAYKPERHEPADFDAFWQSTLDEARQHPLDARFEAVDYGLSTISTYDVTFAGFGGQPIKGWFLLPTGATPPLPGVVEFIGYGGGRGFPHDWLMWPSAGYAFLVMDTRGQGSTWLHGDTPDHPDSVNSHIPGFMTQGILDPATYYYRRVFTDAVRAVETIRLHSAVDADRIAVTGGSQGGAITLAVSGLMPGAIAASMPDVPFLCHFERAIGLTERDPYEEIVRYLHSHRDKIQTVYNTLSYFDGMHFAARTKAPSLYSTALMDTICPPSTVFAAFNHVTAPKDIRVYRFNNHEGGGSHHQLEKLRYLNQHWR